MSDSAAKSLESVLSTWRPRLEERPVRKLLEGLTLYHDFPWQEEIKHGKTVFKNCKDLAKQITKGCPGGMTPALLLTTRDDVDEGHHRTDDSTYLVVVNSAIIWQRQRQARAQR